MAERTTPDAARLEPQAQQVLAAAFYAARFAGDWQSRPYWMVRRCVVPYVAAGQFLVLKRDGLPVAFAGWAREMEGTAPAWRADYFMPSAGQIGGDGECVVTDVISGFLQASQVAREVGRYLRLSVQPPWVEWSPDRKFKCVHAGAPVAGG